MSTAVLLGTYEPKTPEWHAARAKRLGGSEIAAVVGLSKWESRFSLWHRKAMLIEPQAVTNAMDAGTRLEPVICDKFADDHPEYAVAFAGTYTHRDNDWQVANPDRLLYPKDKPLSTDPLALLETKFILYDDEWGAPGTDEIPPYYAAQCQWYLDVFGLDTCYVEVFVGSRGEFREYVVHANPGDQELLRNAGREFMESLASNDLPDIDAHGATYEAIRELHPLIEREVDVELDPMTARAFCMARHELAAAESRFQHATNLVADALGNGRRARFNGKTIAYRAAKGEGTPYLVAGKNLPDFQERTA